MSDPCECFFDHEAAMQRLLSMLRGAQNFCTDSSCPTDGLPGAAGDANSSLMLWTLLWTVLAMSLYMLRPNSMRSGGNRLRQNDEEEEALMEKTSAAGGSSRDNNPPPPPPPSAM